MLAIDEHLKNKSYVYNKIIAKGWILNGSQKYLT